MKREWEQEWHDTSTMSMVDVNDLLGEWSSEPVLLNLGLSRQMRRIPMRCQRKENQVHIPGLLMDIFSGGDENAAEVISDTRDGAILEADMIVSIDGRLPNYEGFNTMHGTRDTTGGGDDVYAMYDGLDNAQSSWVEVELLRIIPPSQAVSIALASVNRIYKPRTSVKYSPAEIAAIDDSQPSIPEYFTPRKEPVAVTEEPVAVTEESAAVTEEPVAVTEEPVAVTEEPVTKALALANTSVSRVHAAVAAFPADLMFPEAIEQPEEKEEESPAEDEPAPAPTKPVDSPRTLS